MKSYCGGPIGSYKRSFKRYHPRPPTAYLSPRLGIRNPTPKLQSLLSQERLKLGTSNLADIFIGSIRTKPMKILEKRERGRIQRRPKFFEYPLLSQERVKLRTSNLAGIFTGPSEQKPLKNLGEKGAWAYPGTAQIFGVPPVISGTGNATNCQFCTHVLSIDRNKRPLQISEKVAVGVVRTLKIFRGSHTLGASRGRLCDSSAYLSFSATVLCGESR